MILREALAALRKQPIPAYVPAQTRLAQGNRILPLKADGAQCPRTGASGA